MSELITGEIFTDGQQNINAANMNGVIGKATVQPDVIANKPQSASMNIADTFLVLKTDNTLAQSRFDTLTNSVASTLPVADTTKNGALRQVSGNATDYVGGDNQCHQLIPTGTVWDTLASTVPAGWLLLDGASYLRTDYPNLFALIGTLYGSVDGTHFNVPDARGRTTIGAGTGTGLTARTLGASGGEENHSLSLAELAAHSHTATQGTHTHTDSGHAHAPPGSWSYSLAGAGGSAINAILAQINSSIGFAAISTNSAGAITIGNTGSGTGHNTMQPFLVMNKMVRV